jgi:hypothetical protein
MDIMRLWSLSPVYLDTKGLLALWREALLARAVLQGRTTGYRRHPQLKRFREHPFPRRAIAAYLRYIHAEARKRGYSFKQLAARPQRHVNRIPVTAGQVEYEWRHLLKKLRLRDPERFKTLQSVSYFKTNPLFRVIPGGVETWERLKERTSRRSQASP